MNLNIVLKKIAIANTTATRLVDNLRKTHQSSCGNSSHARLIEHRAFLLLQSAISLQECINHLQHDLQ